MTIQTRWARVLDSARGAFRSAPRPAPGLHTYSLLLEGRQRRVHLRIEPDGAGALFVDVTDVIHLNPTAVAMVKPALDGVPQAQTVAQLARQYRGVARSELTRATASMYDLVAQLKSDGFGCPTCAMATHLDFLPVFSTPVTAPYKVDLALTYACNNACPHCYNEPERFAMGSLTVEDWCRVLDKLAGIGVPHVILTGGEPTLLPLLPDLIRYADGLGQIVGMNTNGRRLAEPDFAAALAVAGLNHVQVTLESCFPAVHDRMVATPGAFDETVRGIRNALASGLHTITNTTVTRENQDHVLDTVRFVHDLGLTTFALNGIIYAGGGSATPNAIPAEEMAALLVAVRDEAETLGMRFLWYTVTDYCRLSPLALGLAPKRCNAAEYSICIEPNGDVLPCQSYYVSAGNILFDPWEAIWNSDLFLSFRNREQAPGTAGLPDACGDCPDLEMCGGGCRLEHDAHLASSASGQVRAAEHGCARARLRASGQAVAVPVARE
ncbi:MAG: radical SAM protein [Anaerolineae bacterium]|nr:radical SAM protein [Anaerolineae bacterium]